MCGLPPLVAHIVSVITCRSCPGQVLCTNYTLPSQLVTFLVWYPDAAHCGVWILRVPVPALMGSLLLRVISCYWYVDFCYQSVDTCSCVELMKQFCEEMCDLTKRTTSRWVQAHSVFGSNLDNIATHLTERSTSRWVQAHLVFGSNLDEEREEMALAAKS